MGYFSNLSPKLLQDNKMHILYPVNLAVSTSYKDTNTIHNSDSNTLKLEASCGTIWTDSMDGRKSSVGFIHNNDFYSLPFRHPIFYKALSMFNGSAEEKGDISMYNVWSYGHMLSPAYYFSPHFADSNMSDVARFISTDSVNGTPLYRLSSYINIYDPKLSSFYSKFTIGSDRVETYFYPSEFSQKYGLWTQEYISGQPIKDELRVNVDTMLKYLVDVNRNSNSYSWWSIHDDIRYGLSGYRWWGTWQQTRFHPRFVRLFPIYVKDETTVSNARGELEDFKEMVAWQKDMAPRPPEEFRPDMLGINDMSSVYIQKHDVGENRFEDAVSNHSIDLISMGDTGNPNPGEEKARFVGICDNAITYGFVKNTNYVKIYSADTKWISVPFQDKMAIEYVPNNPIFNAINYSYPEYGEGLYTDKYLAPRNLDMVIRSYNVYNVERRALGWQGSGYNNRKLKVLFSDNPIMSYMSSRSGVYRLYNSANMINSIKWITDSNGMLVMKFENTADMLIDNVVPNVNV